MAQNIYKVTKRVYDALKEGRIVKVNDIEYSWDPNALYTIVDYNIPTYTLKTEENKIILYEDGFKKDSVTPNFAEFAATAKADDENNIIRETYVKYIDANNKVVTVHNYTVADLDGNITGSILGGGYDEGDLSIYGETDINILNSSGDEIYLTLHRDEDNSTNEIKLFGTNTKFTYDWDSNMKLFIDDNAYLDITDASDHHFIFGPDMNYIENTWPLQQYATVQFYDEVNFNGVTKYNDSEIATKSDLSNYATRDNLDDTANAHINNIKKQFAVGYSADNISNVENNAWIRQTNQLGGVVRAITYGNGYWIAVGAGGLVAYSIDSVNWTKIPAFTSGTLTGVTYGNGRFILVEHYTTSNGDIGKIWAANETPLSWTHIYQTEPPHAIEGVRFINDRFFAVGDVGFLAYSLDGETWYEVSSTTDQHIIDITYGDGKYVACCYSGIIVYSYNGTDWHSTVDSDFTTNYRHICYGKGMYVAGGQNGAIRYSYDGINWNNGITNGGLNGWVRGIAYSNNRFFVAKYGTPLGEIWFSEDGINWSSVYNITDQRFWCIHEHDGVFVVGGSGGIIYTLDLGINWIDKEPNASHTYYRFLLNKNNGNEVVSESYYNNHATKTDLNSKQDKLTPGDNITILEDGTISANISAEDIGIQVDSALSTTSENPVQNKVITVVLNNKADNSAIPTKLSELNNDDNYLKTSSTVYPAIVKLPLTSFSLDTTLGTDGTPGIGTNRITTTNYFDIQTSSACRITYISCSRRNTSYTAQLILCEYDTNKNLLQRRTGLAINQEITLLDGTRFVKFTCYASGDTVNVADIFYDFKIYRHYQSTRYITCYEDWWNPSKGTTRPATNWYFNGDFDLRMPHPSALVTSRTSNPVTRVVRDALVQQPFAKYLWHDVLAFNRFDSPKYEITTDGVTWTESTLPTALFACKESNSVAILTKASGTNICGARWTWTLTSSGLKSSSAEYFAIGRNWLSSTEEAAPRYVIERGDDLANLTKVFDQVITDPLAPATPIFLFPEDGNLLSNNNYLRLTISKTPSTETRLNLSTIKLLTNRWGDQGKGSEYEHPYSWTADGSVTMMKDFNVPGQAAFTGNVLAANNLNVTGEITTSNNKVKINQDVIQLQQNTLIQKGLINTHPESSNKTTLAYYINGLTGFTKRGGNVLLINATKSGSSNIEQLFNGTTDYFQYKLTSTSDQVEFILQLPKEYMWTNTLGIGFGTGPYWGCKSITWELGYLPTDSEYYKIAPTEDNWSTINGLITWKSLESKTFTTAPDIHTVTGSGPTAGSSTSKPFNYIRIKLTNFVTTSPRIAGIWINTAGDKGLAETYLTRDGGASLYGDLLPEFDNAIKLGSSSKRWSYVCTNHLRANYYFPVADNNGQIGTPENQFWNIAAKTIYEDRVKLEEKYATKTEIDILKAFTLSGDVELSTASGYSWAFYDNNKVNLYYTPTEPGDAVNKDYVDNNFISNNGDDLKTINGQSLVGTGDITIESRTPDDIGCNSVYASTEIVVGDNDETYIEPSNISVAGDVGYVAIKSNNAGYQSPQIEIDNGDVVVQYRVDNINYEGYSLGFPEKAGTIALISDIPTLKTVNGQSLVGTGDITIEGGISRRDLDIGTEVYNILSPDNYIIRPYQENITSYTFTINDHPELYENKLLEYCGEISLGASEVTLTIDSNIISDLRWNTNYNITQINSHTLQLEPKNTYMFSISNSQFTTGIWFGMIYNIPNPMLSKTTITMNGQTASWAPVIGFKNETIEYDVYVGAISSMVLIGTTTSNTMDLSANITTTGTTYQIKVIAKSIYYNNSTTELSYTYSA